MSSLAASAAAATKPAVVAADNKFDSVKVAECSHRHTIELVPLTV